MHNNEYTSCNSPGRISLSALITTGGLSVLHTLSHVVPALGILNYSTYEGLHTHSESILTDLLSHPALEVAYLTFVPLSLYYVIKDYKGHQKHHSMQQRVSELEAKLKENEETIE